MIIMREYHTKDKAMAIEPKFCSRELSLLVDFAFLSLV